mmetsp:Transcript_63247/g.175996  ORF Transcript_63247/g.175996 Transcript_63247/m.175996 type:complete len:218 (-) Transcript_63247:11-664(-)
MGLCTCFWRTKSSYPDNYRLFNTRFLVRSQSCERSFYLGGVFLMHRLVWSNITYRTVSAIFVCATYGSIYLLSSQCYVTLCGVLFLQAFSSCSSSLLSAHRHCDFVLQSYKINIFASALLCASLLSVSIHQGLNVTYLLNLIQVRCNSSINKRSQLVSNALSGFVVQISAIHANKAKISALCLASYRLVRLAIIWDIACITLKSAIGSIGIKVALVR